MQSRISHLHKEMITSSIPRLLWRRRQVTMGAGRKGPDLLSSLPGALTHPASHHRPCEASVLSPSSRLHSLHGTSHKGVTEQIIVEKMLSGEGNQGRLEWRCSKCLDHSGLDSSKYFPTESLDLKARRVQNAPKRSWVGKKARLSRGTSSVFICPFVQLIKASSLPWVVQVAFRKPRAHISQELKFRAIRNCNTCDREAYRWVLAARRKES